MKIEDLSSKELLLLKLEAEDKLNTHPAIASILNEVITEINKRLEIYL